MYGQCSAGFYLAANLLDRTSTIISIPSPIVRHLVQWHTTSATMIYASWLLWRHYHRSTPHEWARHNAFDSDSCTSYCCTLIIDSLIGVADALCVCVATSIACRVPRCLSILLVLQSQNFCVIILPSLHTTPSSSLRRLVISYPPCAMVDNCATANQKHKFTTI